MNWGRGGAGFIDILQFFLVYIDETQVILYFITFVRGFDIIFKRLEKRGTLFFVPSKQMEQIPFLSK